MGFVVSVATGMVTGVVTSGVVAGGRVREVGTSVTGGSAGLVVMATGETAGCPVIFPAGRLPGTSGRKEHDDDQYHGEMWDFFPVYHVSFPHTSCVLVQGKQLWQES